MTAFAISTVWLLALLAAITLADRLPRRAGDALALAAGFAAAAVLLLVFTPHADGAGLLVALAAGARLLRPGVPAVDHALAGACAGAAAALYAASGVDRGLSLLLTAGMLALGLLTLSWRNTRLPREPLLCFVALASALAGLAPGLIEGWRSAALLNQPLPRTHVALPQWTVLLAAAMLLGILKGAWTRR